MNILKKYSIVFLFCVAFAGVVVAGSAKETKATEKISNGIVQLENYKQSDKYEKADVTGNGKNDVIETTSKMDDEGYIIETTLKVNGTALKSWDEKQGIPVIEVVSLSNKKSYVQIIGDDKDGKMYGGLYQVKNNKLKASLDYEKLVKNKLLQKNDFIVDGNNFDMFYATKVSGNTISYAAYLGTKSLGQISITNLKVKYSKGNLVMQKTAGTANINIYDSKKDTIVHTLVAKQSIKTVKSAGSKKKGITIAKNTKFTLKKGAIVGKYVYIQVKTSKGKTGWIKLSTSTKSLVKERGLSIGG
jgi:hypothetical protein